MSVLINQATDQTFIGNLKAAVATANGVFVAPNYVDQSATPAADAAAGDKAGLLLVANVNTAIDEQQVSDANFPILAGRKLRLKPLLPGNVFTTDQYTGTPAVGDVVAVGTGGKLVAVAARTPLMTFRVKEVTTLFGKPAIKVVVETV